MVAINTSLEGYSRAELLLAQGIGVVCGGFPCQDISVAGRGAGLAGSRSGLWREMLRTIRLVRPFYAIVENVAALLSRGMGTVLGDLAESGYDTEWDCISAADVGALHLRERIWIVAHDNSERKSQLQGSEQNQRGRDSNGIEEEFASDLRSKRVQGFFPQAVQKQPGFSWCQNVRGIEDLFGRSDIPEPLVCRKSNGIPNYMDRIKGIGNSVVPYIPEIIGKQLTSKGLGDKA